MTDPLALVNLNCKVEVSNKAYQEWISQKKGPVFNTECDPLKADKNKTCPIALIRKVIETKHPVSEYISSPEGGYYYTHLYPVFDQTGKVIKVVHYVEDVTEKKRIEEQMAITEKLAAIGQLAAGIAHEINNPLGGIILCLDNVIRSSMDEKTKNQHIELINQGLSRIQNIIKVLLDFSRTTELNLRVCEVKDLIENVLKLINYYLKEKSIKLKIELEQNLSPVYLDSNKIEQVLLNLILNAVDAMENSEEKVLTIKVYHKDSKMFIEVSDTGSGIPPHVAEKVFDPFFTTKPLGKGTGLGLFISKSIVEQHGGKIWFTTSEKGTTFVVEIPLEGRRIHER
nr:ATP-binding protein [Thermodesulfobacterium thermophilum]